MYDLVGVNAMVCKRSWAKLCFWVLFYFFRNYKYLLNPQVFFFFFFNCLICLCALWGEKKAIFSSSHFVISKQTLQERRQFPRGFGMWLYANTKIPNRVCCVILKNPFRDIFACDEWFLQLNSPALALLDSPALSKQSPENLWALNDY